MATLFVRHKVADYPAWRRIYDGFKPTARSMGVTAEAVYQAADDPTDLTVTHDFASVSAAQAFAASDALRTAMHDAGVEGAPTIWFTERT